MANSRTAPLKEQLTRKDAKASSLFTHQLAESLGWDEEPQRLKRISIPVAGLDSLFEGKVADETAVLFAGHQTASSSDLVNLVGQLAYHMSVEWGVISNKLETIVFNSHRLRDGTFVRTHRFAAGEEGADELLQVLQPRQVLMGSLDRAVHPQSSDKLLIPIDDALVESLDRLRDDAMRHAKWADSIDQAVHQVFSQFFILRAVEDRKINPDIPPLSSALQRDGTLNESKLANIISTARDNIQKDLFSRNISSYLSPSTVAQIIKELYDPPHLRAIGAKYNFQWVGSEVLGRAYEKYLSSVLVPKRLTQDQQQLFDNPRRDVERRSIRKVSGVFYTPRFLVNFITGKAIRKFYAEGADKNVPPQVADISCGSGSFLISALDALQDEHLRKFRVKYTFKELVTKGCVFGVDIDERAILLAQLSLWLKLAEEPEPLPLPELKDHLCKADSLLESTWKGINRHFDIIVGNPPFVAAEKVANREALARLYRSAEGRFDLAYLFIERSLRQLKQRGIVALVVPNRLFGNRDAGAIRNIAASALTLDYVVDFGSLEVFSGVSAYIGIFMGSQASPQPSKSVRVLSVRDLPDRFQGATLSLALAGVSDFNEQGIRAFTANQPAGDTPWQFMGKEERKNRVKLEDASRSLSDIAQVRQGIKTGANDIFVVKVLSAVNGLATIVNGFGDTEELETDLLKPVVFGTAIKAYKRLATDTFLIYPYGSSGALSVDELKTRVPRTFAYLDKNRGDLQIRSGVSENGKQWYELTRERTKDWLEAAKLVMRDLAPSTQFAADLDGQVFLIGGTAVVPIDDHDLLPMLGFLNSSLSNWQLRKNAPAFKGSFFKIEPQHLESLFIPVPILEDATLRMELADSVSEVIRIADSEPHRAIEITRQIDAIVARAAGLKLEELV